MTREEMIVLSATRGFKSSYNGVKNYRFVEAHRETGISEGDWNEAKQKLIDGKFLNKRGAITNSGRNVIGMKNVRSFK